MKIRVLSALVLILAGMAVLGAQELNLARNENAIGQAIAEKLLAKIYETAGLKAKVTPLPGARANTETLDGTRDGEVARIPAYFVNNPSLFKVEPGYYYLTTGVFAKSDRKLVIKSRDDLKSYKVGYVKGIAHAEAAVVGLTNVEVTTTYDLLYKMLDAGRFDLAIDEGINGPVTLKNLGITGISQVGEIARLDLFHVLTAKNKGLAPKLSDAIKKLKASGELAAMTKKLEAEYQ